MGPTTRTNRLSSICCVLALAGVSASGAASQQVVDQMAVQPSIQLPAALDRVLRDYERHWRAGEANELAALFVEEGLIVRGGTWIRGRSAIREAYRTAGGALQLRAVEYAEGDDIGYIVGAYGYGERPPVEDTGLFVLTLRRDDGGGWLIVSDMDRSGA